MRFLTRATLAAIILWTGIGASPAGAVDLCRTLARSLPPPGTILSADLLAEALAKLPHAALRLAPAVR